MTPAAGARPALDAAPPRRMAMRPLGSASRLRIAGGWAVPALLLFAVALRLPHLGDPAYLIDEQFYLLAGDRLLHGAVPYVDLWDRKPIGLFLIYAAIRLLGGTGIVHYQIAATLCAGATAGVIQRIARPVAGDAAAAIAGAAYLLWLEVAEGGGGQAPVFYNLPMALAAWCVVRALAAEDLRAVRRLGLAAMALAGLAIQIKYVAVPEAALFGLVLAVDRWRRVPRAALAHAAMLAAVAIAPTLLVLLAYAMAGHFGDWWFANIVSIFRRAPTGSGELRYRTGVLLGWLLPFALAGMAGWAADRDRHANRRWWAFMAAWCAASLGGLGLIGTLYVHYVLPCLVPFAVAAAPGFAARGIGPALALVAVIRPATSIGWPDLARTARHRQEIAALAALVPPAARTGCMQVFDGPPALYLATGACLASRFPFPDHLSAANEARAIGVDPAAEMRRLLARNTAVIVTADRDVRAPDLASRAVLTAGLAAGYRLAGSAPHDGRTIRIWVRRQSAARPAPG